MPKKLTIEQVKQRVEENVGFKLLSAEYINSKTKLEFQCPEDHTFWMKWNNFQTGHRCPVCAGSQKLIFDDIKQRVEVAGYTLVSTEYENAHVDLLIRCDKRHEYKVSYTNFQQGQRCPVCSNKRKYSYDFVKQQIESVRGYKLLSSWYVNNSSKIKIQCPVEHEYEVRFTSFQRGKRCSACHGNKKLTYDFVKSEIENVIGYTLLSDHYINFDSKLSVRCPVGHEYEVSYGCFRRGNRCPQCNFESKSSKAENEIQEHVKTLTSGVICNDRTQILNPLTNYHLELDVWLPDLNKAIEYNGVYWHSIPAAIERDKIKRDQCEKLGIKLLTIHEEDYILDKEGELMKIDWFINSYK